MCVLFFAIDLGLESTVHTLVVWAKKTFSKIA